jgi:hypothetical protein
MHLMTKRRKVAVFVMLIWAFLAAGPLVFAATGKCCMQNMCPMKKTTHGSSFSCHDRMTARGCHLRAGICNHELDGLVFSFLATMPGQEWHQNHPATRFAEARFKSAFFVAIQKLSPPPRFSLA